jgi:hypothetical protein
VKRKPDTTTILMRLDSRKFASSEELTYNKLRAGIESKMSTDGCLCVRRDATENLLSVRSKTWRQTMLLLFPCNSPCAHTKFTISLHLACVVYKTADGLSPFLFDGKRFSASRYYGVTGGTQSLATRYRFFESARFWLT